MEFDLEREAITLELPTRWRDGTLLTPGVAYSPDGVLIAVGSMSGIEIFAAATGYSVASLDRMGHMCYRSMAFSPDSSLLAAGTMVPARIIVWDTKAATVALKSFPIFDTIDGVGFSPDSKVLVCSGMSRQLAMAMVRTSDWEMTGIIPGSHWFGRIRIPASGGLIAATGQPRLRVYDWETLQEFWHTEESSPFALDITADGKLIATSRNGRDVVILSARTGEVVRKWVAYERRRVDSMHALAFSPDGSKVASANSEGVLKVWALGGESAESGVITLPD